MYVNSAGNLWFEEYPWPRPDDVFNGHNFALYGLLYYYALTRDPTSLRLLQGALTTTHDALHVIRQPGWLSRDGLGFASWKLSYHFIQRDQLFTLARLTGDAFFLAEARAFTLDYQYVRLTVRLAAGTQVLYSFGEDGSVTGSQTVVLPEALTAAAAVRRRRFPRDLSWLYLNSGPLAGSWVRESSGVQLVPSAAHS